LPPPALATPKRKPQATLRSRRKTIANLISVPFQNNTNFALCGQRTAREFSYSLVEFGENPVGIRWMQTLDPVESGKQ
jgi:hypothetical protein